ncbi:MAG TPA: NAD(P)H-dependent oxidoreductase subunit E [Bacteroidales bacterium]|nr:NAD(P)H-dependent oxidoreductase subunit E [Bacteroidales bacterium]HPJ58231.1 NAD(P)H-dependent oxidoreductase subunit E [Bacteroidales bacterium]HPR11562.1 NAD(P)H-dependent oxidoreductase subunit E [Bacteroidales bacterium]HRW84304.1 NAD(P)H-dependent oxidoreductase subunit E [Bacteroidales bacterium]
MLDQQKIFAGFSRDKSNLLPILHALQDCHPHNYLTEESLRAAARFLGVNLSWVYGVAGYYSMFSLKPRGRYIIRVCNSPVCSMMGSSGIIDILTGILGIKPGETTPDGLFTVEEAECLGICDVAPALMINRNVYGNLTRKSLKALIEELRKKQHGQK